MYIEPNTTILLLKGVKLDNSYSNTIYFEEPTLQTSYFTSKKKHTLTNQSYQRVNNDKMRIELPYNDVYDCSYLMFKNTSFGDKWFYAFITSCEYINNITTQIEYEIDVMQTWYFDYNLRTCYVEREHTITDNWGEHVLPEPIEPSNIVCRSYKGSEWFDDYSAVVAWADDFSNGD